MLSHTSQTGLKLPPVEPPDGAAGKNSTEYFVCQLSPCFLCPIRDPKIYIPALVTALINNES